MRKFVLIAVYTLILSCSNILNNYENSLVIPEQYHTEQISEAHMEWANSLANNLDFEGGIHFFMLTDIQFSNKDSLLDNCVYKRSDSVNQILVYSPETIRKVIIDMDFREIGTMGGAPSLHPHPDGKMIVCLEPKGSFGILGVVLSDGKTESPKPLFRNNTVYWSW